MLRQSIFSSVVWIALASVALGAGKREEQVRQDMKTVGNDPNWIYNDLSKGIAEAKRQNKPMLVVFRCIP